jgi:hypothetical protein
MSPRIDKTWQRGFKKSAEELRMDIPALRQFIDATMPLVLLGNAQQYCNVFNFQLAFCGLFLQFAARCLRTRTDSLCQLAMLIMKEEKNIDLIAAFCLFGRTMPNHFAVLGRKQK